MCDKLPPITADDHCVVLASTFLTVKMVGIQCSNGGFLMISMQDTCRDEAIGIVVERGPVVQPALMTV